MRTIVEAAAKTPAEQAKEIIAKVMYLTIATVSPEGQPWNTPVYASYDDRYHFFWSSTPESQHSRNIATNEKAFVVIYDSSQREGSGLGVYLQGHAFEMTDPDEITTALKGFYGRKEKPAKPARDFLAPSRRRLYSFVPERVWLNTYKKKNGFGVDGRVEIRLV